MSNISFVMEQISSTSGYYLLNHTRVRDMRNVFVGRTTPENEMQNVSGLQSNYYGCVVTSLFMRMKIFQDASHCSSYGCNILHGGSTHDFKWRQCAALFTIRNWTAAWPELKGCLLLYFPAAAESGSALHEGCMKALIQT